MTGKKNSKIVVWIPSTCIIYPCYLQSGCLSVYQVIPLHSDTFSLLTGPLLG